MLESIQSLRRHYPDQVRGYVLSRFYNSTPLKFGGKGTAFFGMLRKKPYFCQAKKSIRYAD